jgi:hypothetical protein
MRFNQSLKNRRFLSQIRIVLETILPRKINRWLIFQYGNLQPATRSWSANGEDLVAYKNLISIADRGYYLDIGCFHPKWGSNTLIFHKLGWQGTVIDLDEYKLRKFEVARGNQVSTIKAAVLGVPSNEKRTVYKFRPRIGWSDLDTLDQETAMRYRNSGAGDFVLDRISVIGINELLSKLPHVNLLTIDIEGMDLEVIRNIDYVKFPIDFILFEDNKSCGLSVDNLLKINGYERVLVSGGSIGYRRER